MYEPLPLSIFAFYRSPKSNAFSKQALLLQSKNLTTIFIFLQKQPDPVISYNKLIRIAYANCYFPISDMPKSTSGMAFTSTSAILPSCGMFQRSLSRTEQTYSVFNKLTSNCRSSSKLFVLSLARQAV